MYVKTLEMHLERGLALMRYISSSVHLRISDYVELLIYQFVWNPWLQSSFESIIVTAVVSSLKCRESREGQGPNLKLDTPYHALCSWHSATPYFHHINPLPFGIGVRKEWRLSKLQSSAHSSRLARLLGNSSLRVWPFQAPVEPTPTPFQIMVLSYQGRRHLPRSSNEQH